MTRKRLAIGGVLALCAASVLVALSLRPATGASPASDHPDLLAIKFHADWCTSCRTIEPDLQALRSSHGQQPILFVTLDLTNETTTAQSTYLTKLLGLEKVYAAHAPKTGYVLLVDTDTKTVMGKLTKHDSRAAKVTKLTQSLSRAQKLR